MDRKKSIAAIASHRTVRNRDIEINADARPPNSPSGTTIRQMTIVCLRPPSMSGNACSMTPRLKNCWRIVCIKLSASQIASPENGQAQLLERIKSDKQSHPSSEVWHCQKTIERRWPD